MFRFQSTLVSKSKNNITFASFDLILDRGVQAFQQVCNMRTAYDRFRGTCVYNPPCVMSGKHGLSCATAWRNLGCRLYTWLRMPSICCAWLWKSVVSLERIGLCSWLCRIRLTSAHSGLNPAYQGGDFRIILFITLNIGPNPIPYPH